MPAAMISLMDKPERDRYAKQMAELVMLMRKNTAQVTRMAALLDKLIKTMGAAQ